MDVGCAYSGGGLVETDYTKHSQGLVGRIGPAIVGLVEMHVPVCIVNVCALVCLFVEVHEKKKTLMRSVFDFEHG